MGWGQESANKEEDSIQTPKYKGEETQSSCKYKDAASKTLQACATMTKQLNNQTTTDLAMPAQRALVSGTHSSNRNNTLVGSCRKRLARRYTRQLPMCSSCTSNLDHGNTLYASATPATKAHTRREKRNSVRKTERTLLSQPHSHAQPYLRNPRAHTHTQPLLSLSLSLSLSLFLSLSLPLIFLYPRSNSCISAVTVLPTDQTHLCQLKSVNMPGI